MEVVMMMFGFMSSDVRYGGGRKEKLYNYRYTVTARMTPALRRAAKRAVFHVSLLMRDNVTRPSPQITNFEDK